MEGRAGGKGCMFDKEGLADEQGEVLGGGRRVRLTMSGIPFAHRAAPHAHGQCRQGGDRVMQRNFRACSRFC